MRTAIVTGAAGGIGEATASDLARWGWRVFGFDLRAGESNLASSDLVGFGGSIEPIRVDVTDRAAVEAAVAAVLAATGGPWMPWSPTPESGWPVPSRRPRSTRFGD